MWFFSYVFLIFFILLNVILWLIVRFGSDDLKFIWFSVFIHLNVAGLKFGWFGLIHQPNDRIGQINQMIGRQVLMQTVRGISTDFSDLLRDAKMTARLHHRASSAASMFHESEFLNCPAGWVRAKKKKKDYSASVWSVVAIGPRPRSMFFPVWCMWIMWMSVSSFPWWGDRACTIWSLDLVSTL